MRRSTQTPDRKITTTQLRPYQTTAEYFSPDRRVNSIRQSEFSSIYTRPPETRLNPKDQIREKQPNNIATAPQPEIKPDIKQAVADETPKRRDQPIIANPRIKPGWLQKEAQIAPPKTANESSQSQQTQKESQSLTASKKSERPNPFVKTQQRHAQQKSPAAQRVSEIAKVIPQTSSELTSQIANAERVVNQPNILQTQTFAHEFARTYGITSDRAEVLVKEVSSPHLERQVSVQSTSAEKAYLEVVTKLQSAAKVQQHLKILLVNKGIPEEQAQKQSSQQVMRLVHTTLQERRLLEYLPAPQPSQNTESATTLSEKSEIEPADAEQLPTRKETKDNVGIQDAVAVRKTLRKVKDDLFMDTEVIVPERDTVADANRVDKAVEVGSQALSQAHAQGEDGITASEVASQLPIHPTEGLVSFIRKQLSLLLNTENQYDRFKD
ncbi:MAG TPA: hypothetical protein VG935_02320, partial [Patescibacteria group bacterium]|nr:hypothetical protein [Patescibacteria group bacterium]